MICGLCYFLATTENKGRFFAFVNILLSLLIQTWKIVFRSLSGLWIFSNNLFPGVNFEWLSFEFKGCIPLKIWLWHPHLHGWKVCIFYKLRFQLICIFHGGFWRFDQLFLGEMSFVPETFWLEIQAWFTCSES